MLLVDFIIAGIFGAFIGSIELFSRYRDAPFRAASSAAGVTYIVVNILSSVGALWLIRLFDVNFGIDAATEAERLRWSQVFVSGFGAMTVLRSSVFVLNIGDQNVSIGPSSILEALLRVLDREVDRRRAQDRAIAIREIMKDVAFKKAQEQLPIVTFALMQNLPRDEQDNVVNKVFGLQKAGVSDKVKAQALGLLLIDVVGEKVLNVAVDSIRDEIKVTPFEDVAEMVDLLPDEELPAS